MFTLNLSTLFNYLTLRLDMPVVNTEIIMYIVMTPASPEIPHSDVNIMNRATSKSCLSFPLIVNFLILSENIGISEIISHENRKINIIVR